MAIAPFKASFMGSVAFVCFLALFGFKNNRVQSPKPLTLSTASTVFKGPLVLQALDGLIA